MTRVLLAVLVVLALAGCGNDDKPAGSASSIAPSQTADGSAVELQLRRVTASGAPGGADATVAELAAFACPEDGTTKVEADERDLACGDEGTKYLLEPAAYEGAAVSAVAVLPELQTDWAVNVKLDAGGTRALTRLSTELSGTDDQMAIVIDGLVLSAARFAGVITGGDMQIAGLTESSAKKLAERLS